MQKTSASTSLNLAAAPARQSVGSDFSSFKVGTTFQDSQDGLRRNHLGGNDQLRGSNPAQDRLTGPVISLAPAAGSGFIAGNRPGLLNNPSWSGLPGYTRNGLPCDAKENNAGKSEGRMALCSSTVSTGAGVEGANGSVSVEAGATATPKEDTRPAPAQEAPSSKKGSEDGPADATGRVAAEAKAGNDDKHVKVKVEAEKPLTESGKTKVTTTVEGKVCQGENPKVCVKGKSEKTDKDKPVDSAQISAEGKGGSASVTRERPRDGSAPTTSVRVTVKGPNDSSLSVGASREQGGKPSYRIGIELPF